MFFFSFPLSVSAIPQRGTRHLTDGGGGGGWAE